MFATNKYRHDEKARKEQSLSFRPDSTSVFPPVLSGSGTTVSPCTASGAQRGIGHKVSSPYNYFRDLGF